MEEDDNYDGVLVPTLMCRCKTLIFLGVNKSKMRVIEIDNLRSLVEIGRRDSKNCRGKKGCDVKKSLEKCIEENHLTWYSHTGRMQMIGRRKFMVVKLSFKEK